MTYFPITLTLSPYRSDETIFLKHARKRLFETYYIPLYYHSKNKKGEQLQLITTINFVKYKKVKSLAN